MKTSDRYNKNYPVSWEQLHRDCRALSWKLLDKRKDWSRIITVARGGLVPAAIIARELNIHLVDTICISSYTMKEQGATNILKRPDLAGVYETWLLIDDLVDTGKTAKIVRDMFIGAHFATVYAKPQSPREGLSWIRSSRKSARIHGCSSPGIRRHPLHLYRPS